MNTCWNCKHFKRTGGRESSAWGWCNNSRGNVGAEDTCDDFSEKDDMKKATSVKIEIVKKKNEVDKTKFYFMVYVYDNKGELIHYTSLLLHYQGRITNPIEAHHYNELLIQGMLQQGKTLDND